MLCSDKEQETAKVKIILGSATVTIDEKTQAINKSIRTSINRLVMSLLRVRPYQDRMNKIFTFQYVDVVEEQTGSNTITGMITSPEEEEAADSITIYGTIRRDEETADDDAARHVVFHSVEETPRRSWRMSSAGSTTVKSGQRSSLARPCNCNNLTLTV